MNETETVVDSGRAQAPTVDVSIIIPCLNEARTIAACVARAREALDIMDARLGLSGEVLVADNGSDDGGREIAAEAGARVVPVATRGYGAALTAGMQAAAGRYLVMGDADLSYDFVEAVDMVARLQGGADLCMGNRFRGGIAPGAMPWKNRYIGNPVLSGVLRILFRTRVGDAHCGLRALTKACFERLRLTSRGMEFASEMVVKSALLNLRIDEVPATLSPDQRGRAPHLRPWRDGWRHLRFMLMLSPLWLFLAPAAVVGLFGVTIIAALIGGLEDTMVDFGPLALGDHWMIIASAAVVIAFQLAYFGVAAMLYGVNEGWRRSRRTALGLARLEYWMIAGAVLIGAGALWFGLVVADWRAGGYGRLNAIREVSAAFTLIILGVQSFFGGFLLSIIAGNRSRFAKEDAS